LIKVLNVSMKRYEEIRVRRSCVEDIVSDAVMNCVSEMLRDDNVARAVLNNIDLGTMLEELVDDVREEAFTLKSLAWFVTYYRLIKIVYKSMKADYDWIVGVDDSE